MASSNEKETASTPSMDNSQVSTGPSRPRFTSGEFTVSMDPEAECKKIDPENELVGLNTDMCTSNVSKVDSDSNHGNIGSVSCDVSKTNENTATSTDERVNEGVEDADENPAAEASCKIPELDLVEENSGTESKSEPDHKDENTDESSNNLDKENTAENTEDVVDKESSQPRGGDSKETESESTNIDGSNNESGVDVSKCKSSSDQEAEIESTGDKLVEAQETEVPEPKNNTDGPNADSTKETSAEQQTIDLVESSNSVLSDDNKTDADKSDQNDKNITPATEPSEQECPRQTESMETDQETEQTETKNETDCQDERENEQMLDKDSDFKGSYSNEFEKFLTLSNDKRKEQPAGLKSYPIRSKQNNEVKRKLIELESEDTTNSSWYKLSDKQTEGSGLTEGTSIRLLPFDESSNMSTPDDCSNMSGNMGSVVSSNIEDNSRMSFSDQDEASNLSAPDSVPTFSHQPVFDESANMAAPDDKMFRCPDTPSSVLTDTPSEQATPDKAKKTRKSTLTIAAEEASEHGHGLTAADLYEYHWPQEDGAEWYMLQEQISLFLDIKSFKRKYPDLTRRVCDKHEKDFLRDGGVVSETQSDLGLTALKSDDVHELMGRDYPAKYQEFLKAVHEKEKQKMRKKQKDYSLPKLDKSKMAAYTKKAMKSASDWNRQFLKERNEERRAYFDMQTFAVHYPRSKFRKLENLTTDISPYQVALIPGQFQEYCRRYTPEELKYFPLNTAMHDPSKKNENGEPEPTVDPVSPVAIEEEVASQKSAEKVESSSSSESEAESSSDSEEEEAKTEDNGKEENKVKEKSTSREASTEKSVEREVEAEPAECRICVEEREKKKGKKRAVKTGEELISCSECKKSGHPSCLDLTVEMVRIVKTYPWQCMECKTCVECMDAYDEDKMLFCDRCDRGYHTFCVGLKSLPSGKWECKSCAGTVDESQKATPKPTPKSSRSGRKIKPVNLK